MEKKLIFVDIDGTLTIPGMIVPPESAQKAIREARAKGHKVFICTGRNYSMMKPVMAYGFDGAVASAGGYVLCGGQVLYDMPMSHELRDKVMRVLAEADFEGVLETKDGAYGSEEALQRMRFSENTDGSEAQRWKQAADDGVSFSLIDEYDGAPVYKIMFTGESLEGLAYIERELGADFLVCRQNVFKKKDRIHGELINRAFDKGTGVKKICAFLNVPLPDTIGFGDSMNDLAMLETVGISVCMENGEDALKQISSMICPAVEKDGLYRTFVQLGLIEG